MFHKHINFLLKVACLMLFSLKVFSSEIPVTILIIPHSTDSVSCDAIESSQSQIYSNLNVIYIASGQNENIYQAVNEIANRAPNLQCCYDTSRLETVRKIIQGLGDDELVILLDGSNKLVDDRVVEKIVAHHRETDSLIVYGSTWFEGDKKSEALVPKFRKGGILQHISAGQPLRSFYAKIFKKIPLRDLLFEGKLESENIEMKITVPLTELAEGRIGELSEVLDSTAKTFDDWKHNKKRARYRNQAEHFCSFDKLDPLYEPGNKNVDMVIFSFDRPMQLYAYMESFERFAKGVSNVFIIYRTSKPAYEKAYEKVKEKFPYAKFIKETGVKPNSGLTEFNFLVRKYSFDQSISKSAYIAYGVDDIIFIRNIDFSEGVDKLEATGAYGFYYRYGIKTYYSYMKNRPSTIPTFTPVGEGVYAWQFQTADGIWKVANSVDLVLYKKKNLQKAVESIQFSNPNYMEWLWEKLYNVHEIGLCLEAPCVVNLPLNVVTKRNVKHLGFHSLEDLLHRFEKGQKIDIKPLENFNDRSPHITYKPTFVLR